MLLHSVVQISLDSPTRQVGGGDDARAGGAELVLVLCVGDRSRDELGELHHLRFGFSGERLVAPRRGGDHAPKSPCDDDWTADRRTDSQLASFLCDWPRGLG